MLEASGVNPGGVQIRKLKGADGQASGLRRGCGASQGAGKERALDQLCQP